MPEVTQTVSPDVAEQTRRRDIRALVRTAGLDAQVADDLIDAGADMTRAKAEIFDGLEPGGIAVLNRDNIYCERLIAKARNAGADRILTFGRATDADARLIAAVADDVLVMRDGRVVESGPAATVFGAPQHPFTQALLESAALG